MAGSARARVPGKGPVPLRVALGTGTGAGSPLPASGTQLPSSSRLPGGRAMGHLWREMTQLRYQGSEPLILPLIVHKASTCVFPHPWGSDLFSPFYKQEN